MGKNEIVKKFTTKLGKNVQSIRLVRASHKNDMSLYEIYEKRDLIKQLKKHLPEEKYLIHDIQMECTPIYQRLLIFTKVLTCLYKKHKSFFDGNHEYTKEVIDNSLGFPIPYTYVDYTLEEELSHLLLNIEYQRKNIMDIYRANSFKNKTPQELIQSRSIQILHSTEVINASKFIFLENDWKNIVNHDISLIETKDSSKINFLLKNASSELQLILGTSNIYKRSKSELEKITDLDMDESYIAVNSEHAIKAPNGHDKMKYKYETEELFTELSTILEKNSIRLQENSNSLLQLQGISRKKGSKKNKHIKIDRFISLVQLFFKINNPDSSDFSEINSKIENTIKVSVLAEDGFIYRDNKNHIDFLNPETRDKFIKLFVVLDRDLKLFAHSRSEKRNNQKFSLNARAISNYFYEHIISHNSSVKKKSESIANWIGLELKNDKIDIGLYNHEIYTFLCNSDSENIILKKEILKRKNII